MSRIVQLIKTIKKDKYQHMIIGVIVVGNYIATSYVLGATPNMIVASMLSLIVGVVVEIIQSYMPRRTVDFNDVAYTVVGGDLFYMAAIVMERIF